MRTLTSRQAELSGRRTVRAITLVKLTTYTDRAAMTGAATHYYASQALRYDYANTGALQQFLPYLVEVDIQPETIPHLPTGSARSEVRPLRLALQNRLDEDGSYLLETLRDSENLLFGEVEVAELLLDDGEDWDTTATLAGDEHIVFYRGEIVGIDGITSDAFVLLCRPQTYHWDSIVLNDPTKHDPRDVGKIVPNCYGQIKKLPLLGWDVGAKTTLAVAISSAVPGQTQVGNSDAFASSGSIEIGGERMSYNKTGSTSQELNITARGVGGTKAVSHPAGATVLEVQGTSIWVACEGPVGSLATTELYARNPLTGDLVRITSLVAATRNLSDTTTIPGYTVGTFSLTAAQIQTMLEAFVRNASVTQQPDVGHPITSSESQQATSGQSECRDGNTTTFKRIDNDGGSGDPLSVSVTFPTPPAGVGGGTVVAQVVNVWLQKQADSGTNEIRVEVGGVLIGTVDPSFSLELYSFATATQLGNTITVECEGSGDADLDVDVAEITRDVTFLQPDPTLDTAADIEDVQYGHGLELFADVTGHTVPAADSSYQTGAGGNIATPADVFRHLIQEKLGLSSAIDETQWALAETRLAALDNPQWVAPMMGETFAEFVGALEYESRAQLVRVEESGGTKFRLLCAQVDPTLGVGNYNFGASVATLTHWEDVAESSLDADHVFTRWTAAINPSLAEDPRAIDAYEDVLEVNPSVSDVPGISTADMAAAEASYGRRDHPLIALQVNDAADRNHSEDLLGYYVHEHKRGSLVIAELRGVPWTESYALELGDVISAQLPWWASARHLRILQLSRDWEKRSYDVIAVEVPIP